MISLTSDDVDGGQSGISVESVQDFLSGQATISWFNISGEPFTVAFKIEVNGKIVDEQTIESAAGEDPFTKSISYNNPGQLSGIEHEMSGNGQGYGTKVPERLV